MKTVVQLLIQSPLEEMALPSNIRYGKAIHKRGGVEIIEQTDLSVEAWVGGLNGSSPEGGGQRRHVRLSATSKGFAWHCAGNPKNHQIFCKHCVALALLLSN